jgi:hypothetical protein
MHASKGAYSVLTQADVFFHPLREKEMRERNERKKEMSWQGGP